MKIPLVLATLNKGKAKEYLELFSGLPLEVTDLSKYGNLPEHREHGATFEDNAVAKARFFARILGIPALADDSGLTVAALGGRPGLFSARYSGPDATDRSNIEKLLGEMEGKTDRDAAFVCVIAIAVPRGPCLVYEATCEGEILDEPRGDGGFGYDPVFFYPPYGKTFAEITLDEKNSVSHRGLAMAELRQEASKVVEWLRLRLMEEPFPIVEE